jgi:hypothetical protein
MTEDQQSSAQHIKGTRHYGTSRAYVLDRLRRAGLTDLANAVERGRISAHAAAVQLGWVRRRPTLGTGSGNQARGRRYRLKALMREGQFDAPPSRSRR